jgi:ComF family protein
MLNAIGATIKPFLQNAVDIIFPPQCLACDVIVAIKGNLCHQCWDNMDFISSPQCNTCGMPFELDVGDSMLCGKCISDSPRYNKSRSVLQYGDNSSHLITSFKYSDKTHACKHFAQWMVRIGQEFINDADMIAPVPLHRKRLFMRRYNQSALLAKSISKQCGVPAYTSLLIRTKNTPPQAGLSSKQRAINVRNAFKINPYYENKIIGKNIILVDDVITTGSTINACVRALKKAGAGEVNVLTLAMTVKN